MSVRESATFGIENKPRAGEGADSTIGDGVILTAASGTLAIAAAIQFYRSEVFGVQW